MESGELGELHTVRSTTLDPAPPPAAYIAGSGGIFRDCAVHDFDAIRWVTGREVVEVYATGANRGDRATSPRPATSTPRPRSSPSTTARSPWSPTPATTRAATTSGWSCTASADSVAAGLDDGLPLRSLEPGVTFPAGPPHGFFMDRFAAAFRAELAAFTEVVAGTRPSPCTVQDALEAACIAEAATLSLQEHRPVEISEVRVTL